jgi:hypothetical protein
MYKLKVVFCSVKRTRWATLIYVGYTKENCKVKCGSFYTSLALALKLSEENTYVQIRTLDKRIN